MYEMQILPEKEQVDVLLTALKEYSENSANAGPREIELADELRLDILQKRRKARGKNG